MGDTAKNPPNLKVENLFIRERNVLYSVADFGELFADYYLHIKDHHVDVTAEHADIFKDALAAFALHCASHPRHENIAWTINFQDPLINLFLAGDTGEGTLTGRVFADNVKEDDHNAFYQDIVRRNKPLHRSYAPFEGSDPLAAAEAFYAQSEQRPGRFFHLGGDVYGLLAAHPEYDRKWFARADVDRLTNLSERETLSLIERRQFAWHCGCSHERICQVLENTFNKDADGLFGGDESILVNCPRCASRYAVTRETMEAYCAADSKK